MWFACRAVVLLEERKVSPAYFLGGAAGKIVTTISGCPFWLSGDDRGSLLFRAALDFLLNILFHGCVDFLIRRRSLYESCRVSVVLNRKRRAGTGDVILDLRNSGPESNLNVCSIREIETLLYPANGKERR